MPVKMSMKKQFQKGFAIIASILAAIAIAVLATAAMSLSSSSRQDRLSQLKTLKELESQAIYVRNKIIQCAINYPDGDNSSGILDNELQYPAQDFPNPDAVGLAEPALSQTGNSFENLECPALRTSYCPSTLSTVACPEAQLFAKDAQSLLRDENLGLSNWTYYNNESGIYITMDAPGTVGGNPNPYVQENIFSQVIQVMGAEEGWYCQRAGNSQRLFMRILVKDEAYWDGVLSCSNYP